MDIVTLGRTGIKVNKNGFGALPIQRISRDEAAFLLRKAYTSGINFYDTARFYSDSEEKIGYALSDVRDKIFIASKSMTTKVIEFWEHLHTSLDTLKTDYIDIFQFHNPSFCPKPGDGSGLYEAMLEAKEKGLIRQIGITNHRLAVAMEAVESGLYDTLQFPFSYLSTEKEIALVNLCKRNNVGFIAMKALSGGLITNSAAAYAFMAQYDNVLPIWGIQKDEELEEFISYNQNPPILDEELTKLIQKEKEELSGDFCRACGYCLPCPVDIDIPTAARMSLLLRRAPSAMTLNDATKEKMKKVDDCIHCDHCKNHCPYGLDTPKLIADNWNFYKEYL